MITRNEDDIRDLIDSNKLVVVQIGASWCMPCKHLKPKIEKISLDNSDMIFAYVDIDEARDYAAEADVMSLPTVIGYHDSIEIDRVVGNSENAVKELVEKIRNRANP